MFGHNDQTEMFNRRRMWMKRLLTAMIAAVFALGSASVLACPGDKAKDEKQMSTPSKPKA